MATPYVRAMLPSASSVLIPAGTRDREGHVEFAPEWCAIGVIAALDVVLAAHIGFRLIVTLRDGAALIIALALMGALRAFGMRRGALMAEYFGLTLVTAGVLATLSYLGLASSGTLVDGALLAADRALGFDWLRCFAIFTSYPAAAGVFRLLYNSIIYQGLYLGLLLSLLDRKPDLREVFWLFLIVAVFTSAGAAFYPSLGPFKTFGLESQGAFLPEMEHLRSGHNLTFALSNLTGVVNFPSFHTSLALIYIYGFRRTGIIGIVIGIANLVMIPSIPFIGGHYLIDIIAGAAVTIFALALIKVIPRLWP